ncbi:MAG TPA: hypothetical protein VGZ22_27265 [Isosphaeraceae bacterium]|nr:hypothetical protein [Isosphaeraceae bacterium]
MRFTCRFLSVATASLGLLGLCGCGEDNEAQTRADSAKAVPDKPREYGQTAPTNTNTNPYQGSGGYPGAGTKK